MNEMRNEKDDHEERNEKEDHEKDETALMNIPKSQGCF